MKLQDIETGIHSQAMHELFLCMDQGGDDDIDTLRATIKAQDIKRNTKRQTISRYMYFGCSFQGGDVSHINKKPVSHEDCRCAGRRRRHRCAAGGDRSAEREEGRHRR